MAQKLLQNDFHQCNLSSTGIAKPEIAGKVLHGFFVKAIGTGGPTVAEYVEYFEVKIGGNVMHTVRVGEEMIRRAFLNTLSNVYANDLFYIQLSELGFDISPWGSEKMPSSRS